MVYAGCAIAHFALRALQVLIAPSRCAGRRPALSTENQLTKLAAIFPHGTFAIVASDNPIHFHKHSISIYKLERLALLRHRLMDPNAQAKSQIREFASDNARLR